MASAIPQNNFLHRDLLCECSTVLAEKEVNTDNEKQAIEAGLGYINQKVIGQASTFPSDPAILAIFNRFVFQAVKEATQNLIKKREVSLQNDQPRLLSLLAFNEDPNLSSLVKASVKLTTDRLQQDASKRSDEIKLLKEWSKNPSRVFTDELELI